MVIRSLTNVWKYNKTLVELELFLNKFFEVQLNLGN